MALKPYAVVLEAHRANGSMALKQMNGAQTIFDGTDNAMCGLLPTAVVDDGGFECLYVADHGHPSATSMSNVAIEVVLPWLLL